MLDRLTDEFQQIGVRINGILDEITKDEPLSRNEVLILFHLYYSGTMSIKEMTTFLHANQGNTSTTCKRLGNLGFVRRVRSATDERSVELRLSEEGRDKCDHLKEKIYGKLEIREDDLDELLHNAQSINAVLARVLDNICQA